MTELERIKQERIKIKGDKKMNEFEQLKMERDALRVQQQNENAELRRKRLAKLAAEKAERQAERDAEIDRELEPTKQTLMRGWLANNPNETADDFEKKAWIHLRQNLIEQRNKQSLEAELQRQMASGRYNL